MTEIATPGANLIAPVPKAMKNELMLCAMKRERRGLMMEMKLYELADVFADLVEKDELTEEDIEALDNCGHAIEVKADNIAALRDSMGGFVAMCKAEEERISGKRKAVENRIKWLTGYLQSNMEASGIMTLEVGTRKIALQKNPPKVVIDDEESIPATYFTVIPQSLQLDKKRLGAALKVGEIKGAHIEQALSLRFK